MSEAFCACFDTLGGCCKVLSREMASKLLIAGIARTQRGRHNVPTKESPTFPSQALRTWIAE
eukprot:scaffold29_cov364-Pavlova_lutheri.AAC.4